jgi:hypothetical protein
MVYGNRRQHLGECHAETAHPRHRFTVFSSPARNRPRPRHFEFDCHIVLVDGYVGKSVGVLVCTQSTNDRRSLEIRAGFLTASYYCCRHRRGDDGVFDTLTVSCVNLILLFCEKHFLSLPRAQVTQIHSEPSSGNCVSSCGFLMCVFQWLCLRQLRSLSIANIRCHYNPLLCRWRRWQPLPQLSQARRLRNSLLP